MQLFSHLIPSAISGGICAILFSTVLQKYVNPDNCLASATLGLPIGVAFYGISQWSRWKLICKLLTYRNWMYDPKSNKSKIWGILLSFLMPKKNYLFDLQDCLPRYPLPKLEETCKRTLEMVKPMLNNEDYKAVVEAMKDLQAHEGPELQNFLEARYKTEENWLSELWDKFAYLAGRSAIPVYSNFCTLGDRCHAENYPVTNQLSQAANSIRYSMEYKEKIEAGSLCNMMIQGIIPICCDRYKYICSTTRIPGDEIDELVRYPNAKHVAVFRKGLIYKLNIYAKDESGAETILTPLEIQCQLKKILDDADSKVAASDCQIINPSIFTTANRTKWAKIRKEMLKSDVNAASLKAVESAAFCISLDTDNPKTHSEEFNLYLTGNGFNRWYDKSLTVIVESNGLVGINVEHSTAEATLSGRLLEYTFYHSKFDSDGNATHCGLPQHKTLPTPNLLQWNLHNYKDDIETLREEFDKLASDVDTLVYFLDKGKRFMKKLRFSPDGYMQMALQLAFYRLHKETPKTYETGTTRLFKMGRTETIRPVSADSIAFTKKFDDPSVPRAEKIAHLKAAIRYQTKYKFDAMCGQAVDRHLLGLYVAGKLSGSIPKLFSLKPFCEYDRLSTSQSPLKYDPVIMKLAKTVPVGGGFGAQRQDGYGVSYFFMEDCVHFLISSYHSCPETGSIKFANAIQEAVDDMKHLLESASNKNEKFSNGTPSAVNGKGDMKENITQNGS